MKVVLVLLVLISASCCKKFDKIEHRVIEKIHTQSREGTSIYYHLLFDSGKEISVEPNEYARAKVGDVWLFNQCNDY
jgi:hypothetical protein